MGIPQPPETFGGNMYSNIIQEAMGRLNHEDISTGSSSECTNSAESLGNATSSSSLRFSDGRTFDEIANEVIQGMQEDERERVSGGTHELRESEKILDAKENRAPQENPVREILDITGTEEEGATASGDWRSHMENTVNQLLVENAEQNAMIKAQREQMTKMVDIVDRIIAYMDWEPRPSHRPSPAISAAGQNEPSRNAPNPNPAGPSRRRKDTATTSQPQSKAKRTKHSGSPGGQKKN